MKQRNRFDENIRRGPQWPISGEGVPEHSDDAGMTFFGLEEQRIQAGSVGEDAHDR